MKYTPKKLIQFENKVCELFNKKKLGRLFIYIMEMKKK